MWSYILSAIGITGLYLAARRPRLGWTVSIAAQGLWVAYALASGQYGFLAAATAYTMVYVRLLRRAALDSVKRPRPTP